MMNTGSGVPVATSMPLNPGTPNGFVTNGALFSGPSVSDNPIARNNANAIVATASRPQRRERKRPLGKRSGTKTPTRATMRTQIHELNQPKYTAPGRESG